MEAWRESGTGGGLEEAGVPALGRIKGHPPGIKGRCPSHCMPTALAHGPPQGGPNVNPGAICVRKRKPRPSGAPGPQSMDGPQHSRLPPELSPVDSVAGPGASACASVRLKAGSVGLGPSRTPLSEPLLEGLCIDVSSYIHTLCSSWWPSFHLGMGLALPPLSPAGHWP